MAGTLEFTLSLEASNFLRNCGIASGGVLSLASAGQGLQSIMHGVWSSIEKGAALQDLSARTGESVENLFKLQHALQIVGVGAESAAPMVIKLQKAMSGVTEDGEKTEDIIKAIGLDFNQLKTMGGPERIMAIAEALKHINKDQASGIGAMLFGREGAGNIMQIARSMADFKQALVDATPAARVFERVSTLFDQIDDTITTIKMKVGGMFAGIAEGIQPALQELLDFLNKMDFVGFGERLGQEIQIAINAVELGKFSEYFTLALKVAIQEAANFMTEKFAHALDPVMNPAPATPSNKSTLGIIGGNLLIAKGALGVWSSHIGVGNEEWATDTIARGMALRDASGGCPGFLENISDAYTRGVAGQKNEFLDQFQKLRESLKPTDAHTGTVDFITGLLGLGDVFLRNVALPGKKDAAVESPKSMELKTTDFTAIEKMGGILGGLGRGFGTDHTRQTAENTKAMLGEQRITNNILQSKGNAELTNQ